MIKEILWLVFYTEKKPCAIYATEGTKIKI